MAMWKITVAPIGQPDAWDVFLRLGLIAIGYPDHADDQSPVREFKDDIEVGDWVVAHLPASRSGQPHLAVGLGRVRGPYQEETDPERPKREGWQRRIRRQRSVEWLSSEHIRMPELLRGYARHTVASLLPEVEWEILLRYGISPG